MGGHDPVVRIAMVVALLVFATFALPSPARGNVSSGGRVLGWSVSGPRVPVLSAGPSGSPDSNGASQPTVFRVANGSYLMYYTGNDGAEDRILAAYSHDGISWTKLPGDIFLDNGAASPFVLPLATGYRMWFESISWGMGPLGYEDQIYGAVSANGLNWTLTGIALDVGNGSAWDAATVADPYVVQGPDGLYRMYYTMYAANGSIALGVATSSDLMSFTKWPGNPILVAGPAGSWDSGAVSGCAVLAGATWTLFYGGRPPYTAGQIGIADSTDGYHWVRSTVPFLPVDGPGTWDSLALGSPSPLDAEPIRLYFDGTSRIGTGDIGFVNVTGTSSGGGTAGTLLGIPIAALVFLVAFVGLGVAVLIVIVVVLRAEGRRRSG